MLKKKTLEFVKMIQHQDAGDADSALLVAQFEESMDHIAIPRFRICLIIFLVLFPLITAIDYFSASFQNPLPVTTLTALMEGLLLIFLALSFVPEFQKNTYAFAFILSFFIGSYNLAIIMMERQSSMDQYIVYALIFSLLGLVMPWGARATAGICFPIYLFYPLGILLGQMPMSHSLFIKSNVNLMLFFAIVTVGAYVNERYRFQEFLLKKRMESVNTILEDYQKRLKRSYQRMEHLAIVDPLTGVYNRTYLMQWLSKEVHKDQKAKDFFSMIMYDFDQFKEINDLAGHQMGDRILQRVAEIVQENVDDKCPIFRYGGDEFCVIMPGLDLPRAVNLAEKVRKNIANHPDLLIKFSPTESFHVTLSMGLITEYATGAIDQDYLIRWVDAALLESKRAGRNCIHVFDPDDRKIKSIDKWLVKEDGPAEEPDSEAGNA